MNEVTIGIACTIIGTVLGVYSAISYSKKQSKDKTKEETSCNTRIETKLDYIGKDVNDIKLDFRAQADKISIIEISIAKVEESVKSAHKRIDTIEEK